jgi:formate hydrogenlyase subunit 3/multisubunit Na+/H+ antiporter MnhD subunit
MSEDLGTGKSESAGPRHDILSLLEGFIDQIQQLRKIMLGVSISAIVLAPLAIGLSIYLILHPSFFAILEIENEFGLVLSILLAAVIIISGIWLATGIRQYRVMETWKSRYQEYSKEKEELDRKIASRFGLNED